MAMIALAALIVITHDALAVDDQRQTIFEMVVAAGHGYRHMPQNRFEKCRSLTAVMDFSISTASMLFLITSPIAVVKNNSDGLSCAAKPAPGFDARCRLQERVFRPKPFLSRRAGSGPPLLILDHPRQFHASSPGRSPLVDRGGELVDTLRIEGGEFANPHDRCSNSSGRVFASRQKTNAAVMVA